MQDLGWGCRVGQCRRCSSFSRRRRSRDADVSQQHTGCVHPPLPPLSVSLRKLPTSSSRVGHFVSIKQSLVIERRVSCASQSWNHSTNRPYRRASEVKVEVGPLKFSQRRFPATFGKFKERTGTNGVVPRQTFVVPVRCSDRFEDHRQWERPTTRRLLTL